MSTKIVHDLLRWHAIPDQDQIPRSVVEILERYCASHNAEFVFGMELRFDAAYRLTRDISMRGGAEFMDFGQGIGRGIDIRDNNQDVIMFGFRWASPGTARQHRTTRSKR